MSGHSKWANIKHKKGAQDARRGKVFTKLSKEITVAARVGGGDPDGNPRLRAAMLAARAENMPKDTIDRAIKKGTGDLEGVNYEEVFYEGYGPGGVAVLVEALTDNRNRAASEVRFAFNKGGGSPGEAGCVSWMFDRKGLLVFDAEKYSEEQVMEVALEGGAEDVTEDDGEIEVITPLEEFNNVRTLFEEKEMEYEQAKLTMVPQNTILIEDSETASKILRMMDLLEDCDDVQQVHANCDIPDEILNEVA